MKSRLTRSVERTIELLREKNHCLEKYYWVNETEMLKMHSGNFATIEIFYVARNEILELIASIDKEISAQYADENGRRISCGHPEVDESIRVEVGAILAAKDELVKSILAQDLKILSLVENEKSEIIRELKATNQTKKAVGAYANSERMKQLDQD